MNGRRSCCGRQLSGDSESEPTVFAVGLSDRGGVLRELLRRKNHAVNGNPPWKGRSRLKRLLSGRWCIFVLRKSRLTIQSSIVDSIDREIVRLLQVDAGLSAREIADQVGLTPTPCWRRIQNLEKSGVITSRVALIDPAKVNLGVTALVQIRTNAHSRAWLERFQAGIAQLPEIVEAYRTSGEIDYVLKVVVPDIEAYDAFYKRLIEAVELYDVRTVFVMEEMKKTTALPLDYA